MKPEAPATHLSSELPSVHYEANVEVAPKAVSPEEGIEKSADHYEQKAETNAAIADIGLSTILPTPVVDNTVVVNDTTIGAMPQVANDDDLIEKEWVDKAKKIVAETKDNPYGRDEAVNKLQVDYIKKRFGREIGVVK